MSGSCSSRVAKNCFKNAANTSFFSIEREQKKKILALVACSNRKVAGSALISGTFWRFMNEIIGHFSVSYIQLLFSSANREKNKGMNFCSCTCICHLLFKVLIGAFEVFSHSYSLAFKILFYFSHLVSFIFIYLFFF
jgi:hypothetical protein